ncbi:MAG TPA: C4-dicarboxylate ABC transporter substrate-binding protein [Synergistaceae bacterium]|nr:C4-dicarboxylate ABC transporter substrate-binding protein [Synergistaceae bacterium]
MKGHVGKATLAVIAILLFAAGAAFAAPMQLTLATGGTAGTYYPLGGAIGQILSTKTGLVNITAQSTGASNENMNLIGMHDVDMAIVQNDIAHYAYNGIEFFNTKNENFSAMARIYPELIQTVTNADSPINSVADFKGKKISVGAPGSGNEANVRQITSVFALDYQSFEPHFLSYAETADHFKDRLIDAFMFTTGAPNSAIQDIATMHPLKFISIAGADRDILMQKYPFFAAEVIPANTYKGQPEAVETVAVQAILIVHNSLPEDVVYAMTKALFENRAEIGQAHHKGNSIDPQRALDGITVPIHPGAQKYYKEIGLIK